MDVTPAPSFSLPFQSKFIKDLSVDLDKTGELIRYLDAAVIKLEGGTDLDLTILDIAEEPPPELGQIGKPKGEAIGERLSLMKCRRRWLRRGNVTMVDNSQEYRLKYWATRSLISLTRSLTPSLVGQ